jgi:hypothetical protein
LTQRDLASNPQTNNIIASYTLTPAELAADNQIEFQFTHAANAQVVSGSFELLNNGVVDNTVGTVNLGTSSIFTNGVNWTRVDIGAFANPGVGLNIGAGQSPREGQTLIASATANDSDATLHYQWQSSSDGGTTWNAINDATHSTYVVQESDEGSEIRVFASTTDSDNGQTATATSNATGPVLDALPTVTTPIVTGTAQEGQTLMASASAGQPDNQVTYAWYSSADNYTTAIGTGATYLVKEGDEGFTIEAKAISTNGNGVTITATSLATSGVLDAAPTVTTPIVTGTAQEGQTLTASASAGQSDNQVTYTWYSSADNYTNAIGTGATYLVKDADQGFTIEAKATATNGNGVQVSTISAATAAVAGVPEPPVLGGAISQTVNEGSAVTLGATDTAADSDDTLGNVTITGLPTDLTNVIGGAYTAATGSWTGSAAQFNALSFTAGEQGTYNLTISATTTGAEAASKSESYTLTVNPVAEAIPLTMGNWPSNVLLSEGGTVAAGFGFGPQSRTQ